MSTAAVLEWAPVRTARREHRCTHCARRIRVGERHHYRRMTPWDHPVNEDFFDYRAHVRCHRFYDEIAEHYDFEFPDDPVAFRRECWRWHVYTARAARAAESEVT